MGVNHSSSCYAGSSCTAVIPTSYSLILAGAYTGSMKDGSVMEPCVASKVLLLDGRVLHFTRNVRASEVLAGFRHHCLCPLDSATFTSSDDSITTFFKPVCLHPADDLLRPPYVYILLPRRTFRLFAAAAAASMRNAGNSGRVHRTASAKSSRVCDSGAYSCTCSATGSKVCNTGATNNSRLCNIRTCPSIDAHVASRVCDNSVAPDTTVSGTVADGAIYHRRTRRIPSKSYHIRATSYAEPVLQPATSTSQQLFDGSTTLSSQHRQPHRRSLDLQHASLSQHRRQIGMRQCRSWRPKLQAINEVHVYS